MLSMVGGSGCHVADVVVGDKRIVEVDDGNSCRIDSVICESSLVNDCDDFGGLLPSFYPEPERVLLSASWKGIIHSVGQEFEGGVPAFCIALAKYAIECGFAVNYLKNDVTRVTAECMMKSSAGCKCRSCSKMVGSRLVPDIVQNDISDNPLTCPIEVKKKLKKQYGIDVSYRVAWLGVDKARGGLFGDFATSFDQLRWYLEMAMRTNLGSVFELDVDESSGCFRRLFVAFHGCLYGFQFCHPLLFVDGTFLKGRYKGHFLATTSKDDCFRESYKESVYPVPSSERFDFDGASSSIIKLPIMKKQPGQNKKKRIPSRGENVKQIKCGRCLKYGNHNKKTCKAAI
ncbi:hypothetical protein ACSBR2_008150 [Camellia fascicularis]